MPLGDADLVDNAASRYSCIWCITALLTISCMIITDTVSWPLFTSLARGSSVLHWKRGSSQKNLSLPSAKQCRDHQRSSLARRAFTQWSDCLLNANHHRRNRVHFCQGTLQAWLDPFKDSKRVMWCRWCLPSWYLEISPLGWERPSRNSPIVFSLIILEALSQFIYFTWDLSVFLVCVIWTFSLFMDEIKHCTIFCEEKGKEYPNIAKDIALWVYR